MRVIFAEIMIQIKKTQLDDANILLLLLLLMIVVTMMLMVMEMIMLMIMLLLLLMMMIMMLIIRTQLDRLGKALPAECGTLIAFASSLSSLDNNEDDDDGYRLSYTYIMTDMSMYMRVLSII